MPRISSEKAVSKVGNRYDLILIASQRARELRRGFKPKMKTQYGPCLAALSEIEEGLVGRDYLRRISSR